MKKGHIDWLILLPVVGLMLFSLGFVYSASSSHAVIKNLDESFYFFQHMYKVVAGIFLIILFANIDYHIFRKFSKLGMTISIILLFLVLVAGVGAKGATRWLDLGVIRIQPSEIAKFALVLHFSSMLAAKQDVIKDFYQGFVPFIFWTGLVSVLIALQPNFSTMTVIFMIAFSMMFIGNLNLLHLIGLAFTGGTLGAIYALSAEYRRARIMSFFSGGESDVGYQLKQALIAIGNGGFSGLGPGGSRQSNLFLPESYGDFIFSIVGEEVGFIGLTVILCCFGLIFWRGMLIAKNAPDNFGYYLSIGITITFAFYVFVNAGVNTGLLPTTGVPFPFLSYGGTAILLYSAAIGILLNISAQAGTYNRIKKQ